MEPDSSDILGQKTMPVARGSNSARSSFSAGSLAFYSVLLLVAYALGQKLWKRFLLWRERSYKLATRRRHGIPDADLRPFNVAYTEAVMRSREAESRKHVSNKPTVRALPTSIDLGETTSNQNLHQRSAVHSNDTAARGIAVPASGGYSSHFNESKPVPTRSLHDYHSSSSNHAPSTSNPRRLARHSARLDVAHTNSDYEAKKRGWVVDEDEEHEAKKTRVQGEELIDGDEDAEFHEAAPKRGWKRGIREDEDTEDNKTSGKASGKRARKMSSHHGYQADHRMDIDDQDEEMDDISELKPLARGKKRDRAEAGSTFGGDDSDSGAEEGGTKLRRRRRKRRTVAKRKSEASYIQNKKRQREGDEDVSDGSDTSSPSKVSSKGRKRGKRSSATYDRERRRSDVSMDESLASSKSRAREIGDEWENNGVSWKIGPNGQKLRLALVKKARQKFLMPRDSRHPDREANMQICVETWLTEEEYQQAKTEHALAWQDSPRQTGEKLSVDTSQNGVPFPQQGPGKNLLWSSSVTSTPTISPASHSPSEGTPEAYQPRLSHSSYRNSLSGSNGPPGSPFNNAGMPNVKRISSTSRTLSLSGSVNLALGSSTNGHDSPRSGLTDSTNANPRSPAPKVFSKWEKQELEAKAIMKVREANKKKEIEREAQVKAEKDAKEKEEEEKAAAVEKARQEKDKVEREKLEKEKAEKEKWEKEAAAKAPTAPTAVPNITVVPPPLVGTGGGAVPNTFFNPTKPVNPTPTAAAAPSSTPNFFGQPAEPAKPPAVTTFPFGASTASAAAAPPAVSFGSSAPATDKKDNTPASGFGFGIQQSAQSTEQPKFAFPKPTAPSSTPAASSTANGFGTANPVKFGFPSSGAGAGITAAPAATAGSSLGGAFGATADSKDAKPTAPMFSFKPTATPAAGTTTATATSTPSTSQPAIFSFGKPTAPEAKEAPKSAFGAANTTTSGPGAPAGPSFGFGQSANTTKEAPKNAFGGFGMGTTSAFSSAPTGGFGKTSAPSAFGSDASKSSAFGGTVASGSTTAPSPFGAASTSNPFAANAAQPDAKSTFNFGSAAPAVTTATSSSQFSFNAPKPNATTPTGTKVSTFQFGAPAAATGPAASASPFGAPTGGSSIFGNSAATGTNNATTPSTTAPPPIFSFGAQK